MYECMHTTHECMYVCIACIHTCSNADIHTYPDDLCLPGDLIMNWKWMCRVASAGSPTKSHLKTIFQIQLYWLIEFCLLADDRSPRRPEWMCGGFLRITDEWSYKTIFLNTTVLTQRALSPIRCSVSQETRTNMQRFCSVSDEQYVQGHLLSAILLTHRALSPSRASQCHWQMAFSRQSFEYSCTDLQSSQQMLCLQRDWDNECVKQSLTQCHRLMDFSRPLLESNYHINLNSSVSSEINQLSLSAHLVFMYIP